MKRIGLIAALPGELKPLVRGWSRMSPPAGHANDYAWTGQIGPVTCVAVAAGMGAQAAGDACRLAEQQGPLDAIVSLGWAGALSCGVSPANAYAVGEVVDGKTEESFPTGLVSSSGARLKMVTAGHVVQAQEKRALAQHFQAVLVDMEGAAVARHAKERGIAFYCFKAVSDAYGEILPDIGPYTDPEGKLKMAALLAHLAFQPKYWRPMARLAHNCKTGAEAIAQALRGFMENAG